MKKFAIWALVSAMLLSMTACNPTVSPTPPSGDGTTTATTTTVNRADDPAFAWIKQLPKMDGSTSTIPLEAGIRAALLGISIEEAEAQVNHNSTYGSYENLLNKECDLIFTVQMSEEQVQNARDQGVELEQVPIAAEGFVFVVNANNPVDSLTQQQLRDIYSGKITNWKEVGGNDAPIAAYQRNETSGSQNYIKIFMGDTPLMEPITEFVPSSMGHLMDAVAYYDNAENAIGYSVYAYAADMYGNGDEIKFIHVDGIEPTKETMANGTYPLLSYNYIAFNKEQPADSTVRKLVEWVLTDEGQRAVQAAGYVPLSDKIEVDELTPAYYDAVGTGMEKPTGFIPDSVGYSVPSYVFMGNDGKVRIGKLTNTQLQQEINAFIEQHEKENASPAIEILNGYLSVKVRNETVFYDLYTAKRIAFTDLYFKGTALAPTFRNCVKKAIQKAMVLHNEGDTKNELDAQAFAGLKKDHSLFSLSRIYLPDDVYHIGENIVATISGLEENTVLSIARDMQGIFTEDVVTPVLSHIAARTVNERLENTNDVLELLDVTYYTDCPAEKINAAILDVCEKYVSIEAMNAWHVRAKGVEHPNGSFGYGYTGCSEIGDRYFEFSINRNIGSMGDLDYGVFAYFDRATGEEVPYDHFFKDGWESAAEWYDSAVDGFYYFGTHEEESRLAEMPDITGAIPMCFTLTKDGYLLNLAPQSGDVPLVTAVIPFEYVDWLR